MEEIGGDERTPQLLLSARLIKKGQTATVLPDAKRAKETVSVEAERPKRHDERLVKPEEANRR
ncbi:hypothetical protein KCU73_g9947, partial [Aureobasidium melanogenum]